MATSGYRRAMTITSAPRAAAARPVKRAGVTVLVWLLLLPGAAWSVIRFGGWETGPLVQLFAFTPYAAVWVWIPAVIAILARRWLGAAVAVVAAALLAVNVIPRALVDTDRGPTAGVPVQVMTANVLAGGADADTIMRLVRDHDVAVLAMQEFTPAIQSRLTAAGLDTLLPHSSVAAEYGTTGSAVYSRFPITAGGSERNGGGFLQAYGTIQPTGAGPLVIESAHPVAPYDVRVLDDWRGDLANQPRADPNGTPRILLGDFNATLDHKALRKLIARGYRDAADADGSGLVGTWGPYRGQPLPPVTIDHVLVDRRIGVRDVQVHDVPRSDHRSVLASLVVPGAGQAAVALDRARP
jgi:endonuclease/exonuclease/phosphatase family metal-dependent hydrolase